MCACASLCARGPFGFAVRAALEDLGAVGHWTAKARVSFESYRSLLSLVSNSPMIGLRLVLCVPIFSALGAKDKSS